ncbi:glycosyltransferase [Prolixibacteraceae bacterium A06]|uniref:Glycosyltransferase n=2 Tax=Gaoshiqia sediminis TaxID=2986998 RepID=A0AA41YBJ8_9BACT|nr:glycosyltransferase [Gaoshiqia sediminis]
MPVYERKEFFVEALESAINQTVKCKIIVVDNCSSHNFYEQVCKEKGITYYRNDENIGMARNFGRCFDLSETEYVMNLQDDDILSPIYVESFVNAHKQHPNIDLFFTNFIQFNSSGEFHHRHTLPFGYMENGEKIIEYGIRYKLGFPFMASVIKKTMYSGFYSGFGGSYDWVWIYSIADKFSFYGDSRELYCYRAHELQDTIDNSLTYRFTIPYIYDEILKQKAKNKELRQIASKHAFWSLMQLKSIAGKKKIKELTEKENIYSNYLKNKLDSDWLIKSIFFLPKEIVDIIYRSMRKIGVTS